MNDCQKALKTYDKWIITYFKVLQILNEFNILVEKMQKQCYNYNWKRDKKYEHKKRTNKFCDACHR